MSVLTHVDEAGSARMVDVGEKPVTARRAVASALLRARPETVAAVAANAVAKGDVLATARIAGIMGAKRASELVPLCHPLPLDVVRIEFRLDAEAGTIGIRSVAACTARTGVEMEAMTGAAVAALTIYDMCKAIDRELSIERVQLEEKEGGRSGRFVRGQDKDRGDKDR